MKKKLKCSLVVEASFVSLISLAVIFLMIIMSFYFYNKTICKGALMESTSTYAIQRRCDYESKSLNDIYKDRIKGKLLTSKKSTIRSSVNNQYVKASANVSFSLFSKLENELTKSSTFESYETSNLLNLSPEEIIRLTLAIKYHKEKIKGEEKDEY